MVLEGQRFGRYLLGQAARDDVIGQLAQAALQDNRFPKDGDYDRVRRHLVYAGADSELLCAVEELAEELQPVDPCPGEPRITRPDQIDVPAQAAPPTAEPKVEQAEDFSLLLAGEPREIVKQARAPVRRRASDQATPQLTLPLTNEGGVASAGEMK